MTMRHFTEDSTYVEIDEDRAERGPRERGKGYHYALCNGFCPCYKEGVGIAASSHLDVLDWFCRTNPELVQQRLTAVAPQEHELSATAVDHDVTCPDVFGSLPSATSEQLGPEMTMDTEADRA